MISLYSDVPVRAEIRDVWLTGAESGHGALMIQVVDSIYRAVHDLKVIDTDDGVSMIVNAPLGWIERRDAARVIFSTWRAAAAERACA